MQNDAMYDNLYVCPNSWSRTSIQLKLEIQSVLYLHNMELRRKFQNISLQVNTNLYRWIYCQIIYPRERSTHLSVKPDIETREENGLE